MQPAKSHDTPRFRVLFLCTGNSARSQIAEAWTRALHGEVIDAYSAGTAPKGVDPRVVQVMAEVGLDLSGHRSKSVTELADRDFDLVVTVCDAARESCPVLPGGARGLHRSFDDPPRLAAEAPSPEAALDAYRRIRDEIRAFVAELPERAELRS